MSCGPLLLAEDQHRIYKHLTGEHSWLLGGGHIQ